jgi:ABC-type transporter Mla subunit MlaD
MEQVFQRLLEMGPGGLIAAFFGWLLLKREATIESLQQHIRELQERRVTETREDTAKMTAALATSSDALETNTASIAGLTRVVELNARGGER